MRRHEAIDAEPAAAGPLHLCILRHRIQLHKSTERIESTSAALVSQNLHSASSIAALATHLALQNLLGDDRLTLNRLELNAADGVDQSPLLSVFC